MSIRKIGQIWWIDIRTPDGKRVRRSTGAVDKRSAQEYHDRIKAELWREDKFGEQNRIFDEAAVRFLQESAGQKDYATKVRHVRYFREHLAGVPLREITSQLLMDILPTHSSNKSTLKRVLSPATKNRYVSTIMRILHLAEQWGWIIKAPSAPKFKEAKKRIRFLTKQEARELIVALSSYWMKDVVSFALMTGMRAGEIISLTWDKVDFNLNQVVVSADKSKSSYSRVVPLNADAVTLLKARRKLNNIFVFTRSSGERINQIDSSCFERACKKTGIVDFRFHDLRHTWASWHAQSGTPLLVLKELGGWETIEMVQRYAHLAPSHLAHHAKMVMFWSQSEHDLHCVEKVAV